jgi:xanthine dehydrogenase molybdenum-binding subunit
MATNKLIGEKYTTPDLVAKVTGKARYAEDWRVEGMLFCKLLTSPYPHAKVKRLDTSKAAAMEGVKAIITEDDLPKAAAGATLGEGVQATAQAERGLTNEPLYQGEPILAVAATSEELAVLAIEAIDIEFEPLPFVVDPIESLRPDGANARAQGNVWVRPAAHQRSRLRRSTSSSGPTTISRTRATVKCRSAKRPTSGSSATSRTVSRKRTSSSTKPS